MCLTSQKREKNVGNLCCFEAITYTLPPVIFARRTKLGLQSQIRYHQLSAIQHLNGRIVCEGLCVARMGNCCLSALFDNGGKDPRVLYHTCSIHPDGSSEECGHSVGAYGSWNILGKENEEISSQYELGEELGRGQFGVIRLCTERLSGTKYACKSIAKAKLTTVADVRDVQREIQILQQLSGHPNIVELKDVFEDQTWVHLVMELCEGGELFDRIVEKKMYSERDAAQVCKVLIEVLQFCHANGVIHRDLKPENILLTSKSHPADLKVADFGLAVRFRPGETHSGMAGSAYYIAPEVLRGEYGQEIDVWSAGVVLYVLLSGVPPFWDELEEGIFDAIRYGHLDLSSDPWPKRSAAAKDLIRGMLCSDIKRRLTPGQILNHEWIVKNTSSIEIDGELPPPSLPVDAGLGSWRSWQTLPSASSASSSSSDTGFNESLLSTSKKSDLQESESFKGFLFDASNLEDEQRDDNFDKSPTSSPRKCHRFDKWTSFTQIMEPTFSEFLVMVVSSLDGLELPSPRAANAQVEVEGGCTCTILKASRSKRTVVVSSSKGRFLVVHDREHRRIGWKHLTEQLSYGDGVLQNTPELDKFLWYPAH